MVEQRAKSENQEQAEWKTEGAAGTEDRELLFAQREIGS